MSTIDLTKTGGTSPPAVIEWEGAMTSLGQLISLRVTVVARP